MKNMETMVFGRVSMQFEEGAYLKMTVTGEEDQPVDLLDMAPLLLDRAPAWDPSRVSENTDGGRDFATLSCDGVSFTMDGHDLDVELALEILAGEMVRILRLAVAEYLPGDDEDLGHA